MEEEITSCDRCGSDEEDVLEFDDEYLCLTCIAEQEQKEKEDLSVPS